MGFFDKLREKQEEMRKAAEAKRLAVEEAKRIEEEAKREREAAIMRIESTIKEKMEKSPLVAELLNCIFNGEKWIVAGQNLDDTCMREVSVEWNLVDVEMIDYRFVRDTRHDGTPYNRMEEYESKKYSFVFAEHGYSPLKPYVDAESGIEISLERMCFILATILDKHMSTTITNYTNVVRCKHIDCTYDGVKHSDYQRHNYLLHGPGWAYYRYMVPDINSQGPLQKWI